MTVTDNVDITKVCWFKFLSQKLFIFLNWRHL